MLNTCQKNTKIAPAGNAYCRQRSRRKRRRRDLTRRSLRLANCTATVPALVFALLEAHEAVRQANRLLVRPSRHHEVVGHMFRLCSRYCDRRWSFFDFQPLMRHLRQDAEVFDFTLVRTRPRSDMAPRSHSEGACAPTGTGASLSYLVVALVPVVALTKSTHSVEKWDVKTARSCSHSMDVGTASTRIFKILGIAITSSRNVRGTDAFSAHSGLVWCR